MREYMHVREKGRECGYIYIIIYRRMRACQRERSHFHEI